ncbi:MAG: hypothetical protein NWF00_09585, partial [Candidatus Bathyarchaeota archaeon]|nr:hypothetical protein [Candidatus Bathyarchaeota archaeon]
MRYSRGAQVCPLNIELLSTAEFKEICKQPKDDNFKRNVINTFSKLEDYPLSLREMDVEKIRGLE